MSDEVNDGVIKKRCDVFVVMKSGKRYMFDNALVDLSSKRPNQREAGEEILYVKQEDEKNAFGETAVLIAPVGNVECWGYNGLFFKDNWWSKQ
jgi:hypothetical protein